MNNILTEDKYTNEDGYIIEKNISRKKDQIEDGLTPIKVFFGKKEHEYKVIWNNPYRNRKERRGGFGLTAFNF